MTRASSLMERMSSYCCLSIKKVATRTPEGLRNRDLCEVFERVPRSVTAAAQLVAYAAPLNKRAASMYVVIFLK